eukprot:825176-Pleurochrysis_carterae.AAC.1
MLCTRGGGVEMTVVVRVGAVRLRCVPHLLMHVAREHGACRGDEQERHLFVVPRRQEVDATRAHLVLAHERNLLAALLPPCFLCLRGAALDLANLGEERVLGEVAVRGLNVHDGKEAPARKPSSRIKSPQ